MPLTRELDLDRCSSGSIGTLSLGGRYEGVEDSSPGCGMPIPESLAGYEGCGAVLDGKLVGGLGAGRLGIRLRSLAGRGPGLPGTGGGARGFSKLPSWLTVGNLGLAGGLIRGDMGLYVAV